LLPLLATTCWQHFFCCHETVAIFTKGKRLFFCCFLQSKPKGWNNKLAVMAGFLPIGERKQCIKSHRFATPHLRTLLATALQKNKPMSNLTDETGITAPEQEIKDVFKTSTENKAWMPGDAFSTAEISECLTAAKAEQSISLAEAQQRIQQIKAFQTHGS
jgi:hypothetical protein